MNSVEWTNGAVWKVAIGTFYVNADNVRHRLEDAGAGFFVVSELETNTTVGTMQQLCQSVYLNARRGMIHGDVVVWDDGDLWRFDPPFYDSYDAIDASYEKAFESSYELVKSVR